MLKLLIASAGLTVGLLLAGAALAEPAAADLPRQAVVKYADLNLASAEGAAALRSRVDSAAREVCGPEPDIRELGKAEAFRACVTHALAKAAQPLAEAMAETRLEETH